MSLGAIRAGRGEVELGLNQTMLELGLVSARNKLQSFASRVTAFGSFLAGGGIAAALTSIPVGMIFATYDQELANLRAATNPTVELFNAMRDAIEKIARTTGESPADVARAFSDLAKAGVSINTILNGAGEAAVMFGRISGMAIGETAVILADAMNVFRRDGLSAMQIATILNRAADSSSVSLRDIADALGTAGATLAMWNQDLTTTATLLGILGNAGIKGAEAGTALKTFFLRLTSGTDGAAAAMRQMGLVVRDNNGEMLPAVEIIRRLSEATRGMGLEQRDQLFAQLAGARGIRALAVLVQEGTAGFNAFQERMGRSLSVQQRFAIMTDTLSGAFRKMWVAIQLAAIKIGDILLPAIRNVMAGVQGLFGLLEIVATDNPEIIRGFFLAAIGLTAWGISLVAVGKALEIVSFLMSPFLAMLRLAQTLLFSATSSMIAFSASVYFRGAAALNVLSIAARFAYNAIGQLTYSVGIAGLAVLGFSSNVAFAFIAALVAMSSSLIRLVSLFIPSMSLLQSAVVLMLVVFDRIVEASAAAISGVYSMFSFAASQGLIASRAVISAIGMILDAILFFGIAAAVGLQPLLSAPLQFMESVFNRLIYAWAVFIDRISTMIADWMMTNVVVRLYALIDAPMAVMQSMFARVVYLWATFIDRISTIIANWMMANVIPRMYAMMDLLIDVVLFSGMMIASSLVSILNSPLAFLQGAFVATFNAVVSGASGLVSALGYGLSAIVSFAQTAIAWIRTLDIASALLWAKQLVVSFVMGVFSIATYAAAASMAALSGAYVVAAAVGNFFVFTLGLYKVALFAVTIAQAIATSGLSLLLGVMVTLASATLTVAGVFLAVTGAAALFVGLGGSFAAIADWLEVIDDIVEFLADGFYAFIDAVMDSPIGTAISWITEVVMELWNSFGLLYDGVVGFLVASGLMEIAENVMYAIVGAVAVLVTLIGIAAYGWYQLLQQFSIRDVFSYINRGIMDFSNAISSIAVMIRPTITAIGEYFAGMFSYLISTGRSTVSNLTSLFVDSARYIASQMTVWFSSVFQSISNSVVIVRDQFLGMFARLSRDVSTIWEAMQNAFSAGNWRLLWDIAVISFRIAWHEISAFSIDTFYALKDALVDVFNSTTLLIQNVFTRLWANVKAGFLTMMSEVLDGLGVGGMRDFFAAIGVDVGTIGQAAMRLRGMAEAARVAAGNVIDERNQGQEGNANANEMARWFRDQARQVENEMAGNALRNELDQIAIQAWFEAQANQVNQEIAGEANRRNFGEGNEVARMNASAIGTFSSDVAKGFLGAGPESPAERAARELAEANRLAAQQLVLLRQIVAQAGFPMFLP